MILRMVNKINVSIRIKIVIIFALATIIPLGVIGAVSYIKYFDTMQKTVSRSTSQIAEQLNRNIELFFNNINKILDMGNNDLLINFLDETDHVKKYAYAKEIGKLFEIYKGIYDFQDVILDINIIGMNGNSISDRFGAYTINGNLKGNDIYKKTVEEPDKLHIILDEKTDFLRRLPSENILTIAKIVRRPLTKEIKGIILVDIDKSAIEKLCSNIKLGDTGQFFVVTKDGRYIYNPVETGKRDQNDLEGKQIKQDMKDNKEGYFIKKIKDVDYFIVYNTLKMPGWNIIGKVKLKEIMKSAYEIKTLTIVIECISILAIILLYSLISNTLTMPIRELRHKMKLVETGNLDVEAKFVNNDEIADLSKGFNVMLIKIKELMTKNLINQENLKKSEFKAMQAQINPHFLYNTLDAIVWMTEADNKEEVVNITKDLSNFFRVVLSKGKDWILISDEVTHVRSYLGIQKVRYRDILEYDIDINPEILHHRILKLTLQPLVENALYHGLKNKRGGGYIVIKGDKLDEGNLVFEVKDNGIGMTEDRLEEVLAGISQEGIDIDMKSGFGLKNVNQRIKLYYGEQYGLSINSKHNKGTSIKVVLPIVRQI